MRAAAKDSAQTKRFVVLTMLMLIIARKTYKK